jgi:adenylate cyclase
VLAETQDIRVLFESIWSQEFPVANRSLVEELKRRNVFRVAIAYLAGSWLAIQIADTVLPRFGFGEAAVTNVIILIGIGFVPAMLGAWLFQRTSAGIRLDTAGATPLSDVSHKRFDQAVIGLLVLAVVFFAVDKFILDPARDSAMVQQARDAGRADAAVEAFGDRSIAVLPFVNLSSDPEQEYFSDGISEELLNLLAQIPQLRVVSRSTAFTFKGTDIVIPEVARKLNVAHVLEGSVRKAGNKLRITAQLIDGRTDTHLWSETYDRETGDVFAIQDEIAARVVNELKLKLLGGNPSSEEIDPLAYDLYLRARHLLHEDLDSEEDLQAYTYLKKVQELEPDWVPGIAELLRAVYRLSFKMPQAQDQYRQQGWELLETLERVDVTGARALSWRGWLNWNWLGDMQLAARYQEEASAIDPRSLDFLRGMSIFLFELQRYEEARAVAEYLVSNDPACTPCISTLTRSLRALGRHREAAERLEKILEWREPSASIYWLIGVPWLVAGEPAKALAYFEKMDMKGEENLGRMLALHDLGRMDEFERDFERFRESHPDEPEGIARIYAWTGNRDQAFHWLDVMVEKQGPQSVNLVKTDLYSKIQDDPRWQAFLERNDANDQDYANIRFNPVYLPEIQQLIDAPGKS